MKKYALIQDNKIIKFKNVPNDDAVIVPKLLAHEYLIVEEQATPSYDWITQTLTDDYETQKNRVLRVWTIEERSFSEAKQAKKDAVEMKALDDIKEAFLNGDQKTKIDKAVEDKDAAVVKIEAAKDNADLRAITSEIKVVK